MGAEGPQSGGVIEAVNEAVGQVPWVVVVLLIAMILSGLVLLVARLRANVAGGGGDLDPDGKKPGSQNRR